MNSSGRNRKDRALTVEDFDSLLEWLDPDRDRAGAKYEEIRRRLIKIFMGRGCSSSDDLADETINRVTRRLPEIKGAFSGDPVRYFYALANKVHLEYLRRPVEALPTPDTQASTQMELQLRCLEECLEKLPEPERELLLMYYSGAKQARNTTNVRNELAKKLGISLETLRVRAFRSRVHLQNCMQRCLDSRDPLNVVE
jgi:RNA polymerase sigma factor (sigma-70 family)